MINSLYLSGWEYNRLLSDDPTSARNSAIPASILWNGAHQLWMFEHVYVTREAWLNERHATEELGWVMGEVLETLKDENVVRTLDWSEFDAELREDLRDVHRAIAPHARETIPSAIRGGASGQLEMFKNALLAPVLRRYGCVASGAPTSLETWMPSQTPAASESDTAQLMRRIAEPLLPGVQVCKRPNELASDDERRQELIVQAEIEKPMIADLLAGEGEFEGPEGYVPYVAALKKKRAAYEPVSEKMRESWCDNRDQILRLRDAAQAHLWEHLHGEWLPRIEEGDDEFARNEFPRLIGLALKARPFARYLDGSKVAPAIVGAIALPTLMFAVRAAAAKAGIPEGYADLGATTAIASSTVVAAKGHGIQAKQVKDLAVFYQRSRAAAPR
jgi:hypothetical protein